MAEFISKPLAGEAGMTTSSKLADAVRSVLDAFEVVDESSYVEELDALRNGRGADVDVGRMALDQAVEARKAELLEQLRPLLDATRRVRMLAAIADDLEPGIGSEEPPSSLGGLRTEMLEAVKRDLIDAKAALTELWRGSSAVLRELDGLETLGAHDHGQPSADS
jgi:hypothetical protein